MRGGIQKERAQVPDCLYSSWKWGCLGDRGDGPHLRHQHPPTLTYILCNAGCYRMGTIRVPILELWEEQWNSLMNLFSWCFVKKTSDWSFSPFPSASLLHPILHQDHRTLCNVFRDLASRCISLTISYTQSMMAALSIDSMGQWWVCWYIAHYIWEGLWACL